MSQVLKDIGRERVERTLEELEDTLRMEGSSKPCVFMQHAGTIFELPLYKAPTNLVSLARLLHTFKASRAMSFDGGRILYATQTYTGTPGAVAVH